MKDAVNSDAGVGSEPVADAGAGGGPSDVLPRLALETSESTEFGQGWISGLISAVAGLAALGTVLCFHFPGATVAAIRSYYPVELIRALIHLFLFVSFVLGSVSICLRRNKTLGLIGIGSTLVATLLGGSAVEISGDIQETFLGLDWVILDLILYSAVYIPLERLFALHPGQPAFRKEWTTDITYFFLNGLLIQVIGLLTIKPAMLFFDWARLDFIVTTVSGLPLPIQVLLCVLLADLTQYWIHRAYHQIPALWRFHAIHHSAEVMDWMAGARLHFVDAVSTRCLTYIPLFLAGFSEAAIASYLVIVVIQATFIHANVRWEFRLIQKWIATPCFHHWHHAAESQAIDRNFAVHTPIWDRLFGTCYLPGRWPYSYGLCGERDVPSGWIGQFLYPLFRRSRKSPAKADSN